MSDDSYGPALPPGLQQGKTSDDSSSDDDQFGPALPKHLVESIKTVSDKVQPTSKQPTGSAAIGPLLPPNHRNSSDSDSDSSSVSSSDSGSNHSSRKKKKLEGSVKGHGTERKEHSEGAQSATLTHRDRFADSKRRVLGPSLPQSFECDKSENKSEESDDDIIGPRVDLQATEEAQSAVREFETRAMKMKEKLTSTSMPAEVESPKKRETWMTELPEEVGASFGLSSRQFRKRDAPEQDSSWTEAPHEKGKKSKGDKKGKKDKQDYFQSKKEKQAAKEIDAYNKKHRPESLLEMHKKEMKKKKKKEKKNNKDKDKEKERRPFDRDIDLKVNRFDNAQKQAYIKRSQELGSRFKSGGTGTSFL